MKKISHSLLHGSKSSTVYQVSVSIRRTQIKRNNITDCQPVHSYQLGKLGTNTSGGYTYNYSN